MDDTIGIGWCKRRRVTGQIVVDLIIWIAVSAPVIYLFLNGKPYQTGFFCDDPSLSYPYKPSSISTPLLLVVGLAASVFLVILIEALNVLDTKCRRPCRRSDNIMSCVKSYIVFLIGFLIEDMMVEVVKNTFGALRPYFFDVCSPHFNRTLCPGYISEYTCTREEDDQILRSSRQSFPSGHAAFSMYTAMYFSIYLETRLQIRYSRLLKVFLQSGLVLVAILCGLGRIRSHHHHPSDVIAGFTLGISVAVFVTVCLRRKICQSDNANTRSRNLINKSCDSYCTCQRTSDLTQEPPNSIQNEYLHTIDNSRDSPSTKLISLQNNNHHQPPSTGIPKFQLEDV